MKVSALYIYPIKSLQGVSLTEANVREKGFQYDRRWMIIDSSGEAITQRTHTQLSQIRLSMEKDQIILSHKDMADLTIPLILTEGKAMEAVVWGDKVKSIAASDEVNEWFTAVVNEPCKLVFMPEEAARPVDTSRAKNGEQVSFADGYPYLIIGQASLDDLNARMDKALPMNRFRPNIVVEGTKPYEEDEWGEIQIGEVKFRVTHPCKRCVFTTVDQDTGTKGAEPLKTLSAYRREGKSVIFGVNTLALEAGTVNLGDPVHLAL